MQRKFWRRWKVTIFSSRRWNSQNCWRKSTCETIHLNQGSSWKRRGASSFSRRIRRTPFSNTSSNGLNTRRCGSPIRFPSITGDFIYRHHVEPRVKLYMPREELFPIPLKCIDGEKYWWLLERGWRKRSGRCMDRLHKIHFIERNATWRIYMVWWETYKQPQDPTMYGQICGSICLMQRKAKQSKSGPSRNRSSIFSDNYVVTSSLNQMMKNLHTVKNARRKLEIPMPAAMPCKTPAYCRGETCRDSGERKTKYACIVDADESMRIRFITKITLLQKEYNHLNHYNLVHKFIPSPSLKKNRCQGCSGKKCDNEENTGMAADRSQKKRGDRRRKE